MRARLRDEGRVPAIPDVVRTPQLVGTVELDEDAQPLKVARVLAPEEGQDGRMTDSFAVGHLDPHVPPPSPTTTSVAGGEAAGGALQREIARLQRELAEAEASSKNVTERVAARAGEAHAASMLLASSAQAS
eukprot:8061405-Lingulodinium_polyedra.AAC.1